MTVTEFLKKHASKGYKSLDDLYPLAKKDLLRPGEDREDFTRLLSAWMKKFRYVLSGPGSEISVNVDHAGGSIIVTLSY